MSQYETQSRQFRIAIAGRTVEVETIHTQTYTLCRSYLTENEPDFSIRIGASDLERERAESAKTGSASSDAYLETLAVYRKISEEMLRFDTFLMHGAAIAVNGGAYLFIAKSGTGKTTHIRKWLNELETAFVVNGDKPLIRLADGQALVCGTPWSGKEHMNTNTMVPLRTIVLMERADENRMIPLSFSEALPMLLQQTYRPVDASQMRKTLSLLSELGKCVAFFRFRFDNFKDNAFEVARQTLIPTAQGQ